MMLKFYERAASMIEFKEDELGYRPYWNNSIRIKRKIGQVAGHRMDTGHHKLQTRVDGVTKAVYASKLSWFMEHGVIPERRLSFRDGNRSNNHPDNLVQAARSVDTFRDWTRGPTINDERYYDEAVRKYEFKNGGLVRKEVVIDNGPDHWRRYQVKHELPVGHTSQTGYVSIKVRLEDTVKSMFVHRIHWYMVNGYIPKELDHIDGDKSNNEIDNLREVTRAQNQMNIQPRKGCRSKYKGVSWAGRSNKWVANIKVRGVNHYLGMHEVESDAALAYNQYIIDEGLEQYAYMNVID